MPGLRDLAGGSARRVENHSVNHPTFKAFSLLAVSYHQAASCFSGDSRTREGIKNDQITNREQQCTCEFQDYRALVHNSSEKKTMYTHYRWEKMEGREEDGKVKEENGERKTALILADTLHRGREGRN